MLPAKPNALLEGPSHKCLARIPVLALVGNIILHPRPRVNLKLPRVNRSAQARVIPARILTFTVTFGVIDVLGGEIASQALGGDFELAGSVAVGEEAEGHAQIEDSWKLDFFERGDVNCLAVVPEPIAEKGD